MTATEWEAALVRWHELATRWMSVAAAMMNRQQAFMILPESPCVDVPDSILQAWTEDLQVRLGAGTWLDWYLNENDMGTKGLEAGYDTVRPIRCLRDLAELLAEEEIPSES